jgi:predicted metal-binding membrane protein
MRMAAVFTLAVSPVGIRTSAVPRWVRDLGYLVGLTLLVAAGAYQWTPARIPCLG